MIPAKYVSWIASFGSHYVTIQVIAQNTPLSTYFSLTGGHKQFPTGAIGQSSGGIIAHGTPLGARLPSGPISACDVSIPTTFALTLYIYSLLRLSLN